MNSAGPSPTPPLAPPVPLQADIEAMRSLGEAQAALLELEGRVAAEAGERDRLVDMRFGLLSGALGTINAELSQARRRGGRGAAERIPRGSCAQEHYWN